VSPFALAILGFAALFGALAVWIVFRPFALVPGGGAP
jgi:hypothetical protein